MVGGESFLMLYSQVKYYNSRIHFMQNSGFIDGDLYTGHPEIESRTSPLKIYKVSIL